MTANHAFTFPTDAGGKAGAVRPTSDDQNFFSPTVIYGPDGVTPISSTSPMPIALINQTATSGTLQNAQTGNANGTSLSVDGYGTAVLQVVPSTFTGTVNFEVSADGGTTWVAKTGHSSAANVFGQSVTSPSANDIWRFDVGGLTHIRARTSGVTAGSVTITGRAVPMNDTAKNIQAALSGSNATKITSDGTQTGNAVYINGSASDGLQTTDESLYTMSRLYAYNESSFDRVRNNTQGTLLASAARTATTVSSTQTNYNSRGVIVGLSITVASGTGGLQLQVQTVDPITGNIYGAFTVGTAITATGNYGFEVYPGSSAAASGTSNASIVERVSATIGRSWRVAVVHGDATSYTYAVSYSLIN